MYCRTWISSEELSFDWLPARQGGAGSPEEAGVWRPGPPSRRRRSTREGASSRRRAGPHSPARVHGRPSPARAGTDLCPEAALCLLRWQSPRSLLGHRTVADAAPAHVCPSGTSLGHQPSSFSGTPRSRVCLHVDVLHVETLCRGSKASLFLFSAYPQINSKANVVTSPKENAPPPALVHLDSVTLKFLAVFHCPSHLLSLYRYMFYKPFISLGFVLLSLSEMCKGPLSPLIS